MPDLPSAKQAVLVQIFRESNRSSDPHYGDQILAALNSCCKLKYELASKGASSMTAGSQSTSTCAQRVQVPGTRQAIMFLDESTIDPSQILTSSSSFVMGSHVLSKSMRVHPVQSRLDFPILLLDSTVNLLQPHFPAVERQQDSCPKVGFHSSP